MNTIRMVGLIDLQPDFLNLAIGLMKKEKDRFKNNVYHFF